MLTQCPGKLKPKDLKEAINMNRARRAEQREEQAMLRALTGGDDGAAGALSVHSICAEVGAPLREVERNTAKHGDDNARQLKELAFLQDLADLEVAEKEREFKGSEEFLGEPLLSLEEIEVVERKVSLVTVMLDKKRRSELCAATETTALGPAETRPHLRARVVRPVDAAVKLKKVVPQFDALAQDLWAKRASTFQKLVTLVRN